MKAGTENRKKTILAAVLGTCALIAVFFIYRALFADDGPPAAPAASASPASQRSAEINNAATTANGSNGSAKTQAGSQVQGIIPGVDAKRVSTVNTSLDPTLDEVAMLRTERLVYAGTGRNIFSLVYQPPAPAQPKVNVTNNPRLPPPPPPQPCPPNCPTPPPPPQIPLKFFGTVRSGINGPLQAFLLDGEDVYMAKQGDIVARKYKIASITAMNIQVEDLTNHNTQTLPLQLQ